MGSELETCCAVAAAAAATIAPAFALVMMVLHPAAVHCCYCAAAAGTSHVRQRIPGRPVRCCSLKMRMMAAPAAGRSGQRTAGSATHTGGEAAASVCLGLFLLVLVGGALWLMSGE